MLFNCDGGYNYGPFYRWGVQGHHPPLQAATPAALDLRGPQPKCVCVGGPGEDGGEFPASRWDGSRGKHFQGVFTVNKHYANLMQMNANHHPFLKPRQLWHVVK